MGDLSTDAVRISNAGLGFHPSFNLDAQCASGPPGARVRVEYSRRFGGDGLGSGDYGGVDAVEDAVGDVGADFPSDMANESGDRDPGNRVGPGPADRHADQSDERAG